MWWANGIVGGAIVGLMGGYFFGFVTLLAIASGGTSTEAIMAVSAATGGAFVGLVSEFRLEQIRKGGSVDD